MHFAGLLPHLNQRRKNHARPRENGLKVKLIIVIHSHSTLFGLKRVERDPELKLLGSVEVA
jgi:hypothetical protein